MSHDEAVRHDLSDATLVAVPDGCRPRFVERRMIMGSGTLLGTLAFGTLGIGLIALIWHFTSMLRDPAHRFHARNIFVGNGKAAATSTAEQAEPGSQLSRPLMVRLNESIDSQHEVDPSLVSTQAHRVEAFHSERVASSTNVKAA